MWRFLYCRLSCRSATSPKHWHTRHPGTSASRSCICSIQSVLLMFGPLGLSLAPYVNSSRTLSRWITPFANWYANASGYRKYGFKYDDLCRQSQLIKIDIFRSPPLLAFSGWRNSRRSASMPNIIYICAQNFSFIVYRNRLWTAWLTKNNTTARTAWRELRKPVSYMPQ